MATASFLTRPTRNIWARDIDGVPYVVQGREESIRHTFDFTDDLADRGSGVTISSVAWTSEGPTLSSASTSSPTFAVTVTGSGDAVATITLSNSEVLKRRFRWKDRAVRRRDYE